MSPQTQLLASHGEPRNYPDDPGLDAVAGSGGRPAGVAITVVSGWWTMDYDYAYYMPGNQRITLTRQLTTKDLTSFRVHVKTNAKARGRCRRVFGLRR